MEGGKGGSMVLRDHGIFACIKRHYIYLFFFLSLSLSLSREPHCKY